MEMVIGNFVSLYLLLPIMAVVLGFVCGIIAKKNKLLSNKKAVFYFLLAFVVLAVPGFLGFIDYWFMPYFYVALQAFYFLLGWYNLRILRSIINGIETKAYYVEFLIVFVTMFVGAALFSLIFNLCNELQYGLWACTCLLPFIFPSLFRQAYRAYIGIPLEIYEQWQYGTDPVKIDVDLFSGNKVIVVELELFKQIEDTKPLNIKAKASEEVPFGMWFKLFIDDYNKKSPSSPISHSDTSNSYGWIFYTNTLILGRRRYIDPKLSFVRNKIRDNHVIMAKRTQREKQL